MLILDGSFKYVNRKIIWVHITLTPAVNYKICASVLEEAEAHNITKTCLYKYIEISPPKTESSQINSDINHISAQNIDCGYSLEPPHRGGSNEYPQSMFLSTNKENNVYPCKPSFTI